MTITNVWRHEVSTASILEALSYDCLSSAATDTILGYECLDVAQFARRAALNAQSYRTAWGEFLESCEVVTGSPVFSSALAALVDVDAFTFEGAIAQSAAVSELATMASGVQELCLELVDTSEIERDWDRHLARACRPIQEPQERRQSKSLQMQS